MITAEYAESMAAIPYYPVGVNDEYLVQIMRATDQECHAIVVNDGEENAIGFYGEMGMALAYEGQHIVLNTETMTYMVHTSETLPDNATLIWNSPQWDDEPIQEWELELLEYAREID